MTGRFRKGKKAWRKFDGFTWNPGTSGKQRALYSRYWRYKADKDYQAIVDDEANHWLCSCGNYQEDGMHCSDCGAEPPWGCDCSFCNDERMQDEDEDEDEEEYYPGDGDFYGRADGL